MHRFHAPPKTLPANATIVDLGSNVGYTVADLAYRNPTARVIGVEMDADNFELARRNTAWLGSRVQLVHAAAWTHDGRIVYGGGEDDAFSVIDKAADGEGRSAPAMSLDTLFATHSIERADYVKMDIEGAEGAILSGPLAWLARVDSLKIEIHPPVDADQCRRILEQHGFRCWMDQQHWNCLCAVREKSA